MRDAMLSEDPVRQHRMRPSTEPVAWRLPRNHAEVEAIRRNLNEIEQANTMNDEFWVGEFAPVEVADDELSASRKAIAAAMELADKWEQQHEFYLLKTGGAQGITTGSPARWQCANELRRALSQREETEQ